MVRTKFGSKRGVLALAFLMLIYFFILSVGAVYASGDFNFIIDNGKAIIIEYTGDGGNAFIPSELDGYPVTRIGEMAFYSKDLDYASIPDSVIAIDDHAFAGNQLYGVDIGKNVISIGTEAFFQNELTSITIPDSVTSIGGWAFFNNQLTKVTIPRSVTSIGNAAFAQNKGNVEDFTIYGVSGSAAETYATENKHTFIPIKYTGDYTYAIIDRNATIKEYKGVGGDVEIPPELDGYSVTGIGDSAFMKKGLTSVIIPDGVTRIGDGAFAFNHELTSAVIGQSVTSIGAYAFNENQLTAITIPDSVLSISAGAFYSNQLNSADIGSSVTDIGLWAFGGNRLTSIIIPKSVTSISGSAFVHNALTSVTIHNSMASMGEDLFIANQENLEDIVVYGVSGSTAETYANENGHTFIAIQDMDDDKNNGDDERSPTTGYIYYGLGLLVLAGGAFILGKRRKKGGVGSHKNMD